MTITLISVQRPNFDDHKDDQDDDLIDHEVEEEEQSCCSSYCMKCLGLSWRDFM